MPCQRTIRRTIVVCADLECLVSSHDQTGLAVFLVLQEAHISSASLLPVAGLAIKLEQLGTHLEGDLLGLLVSLGVDFFGKLDDRFEMDIGFLFLSLLL